MEIEIILKLLLSAMLGGIIGLERHITQQASGLRSHILIAVGSTLFTVIAFKTVVLFKASDPAVFMASVVIGAGLLGAAVIFKERILHNGITTAAGIWIIAAIGVTVGSGYYLISLLVTVFVLAILIALKYISKSLDVQHKLHAYIISTEDRAAILIEIKKTITELGIKYIDAALRKEKGGYEIAISVNTSQNKNREFIEKVMQIPGVREIISEHL